MILVELVLVVLALVVVYRALRPVQKRLEDYLRRLLTGRRGVIDAEVEDSKGDDRR